MYHKTEIEEYLANELIPYFEHKKYVWHSGIHQFIRPTRFGHAGVVSLVTGSDEQYRIQFFIGIRHNLVEQRLAGLCGTAPYYQEQSYTLLPSFRQITVSKSPEQLLGKNKAGLTNVVNEFIHFMDMEGFDFLDHYRKAEHLDALFNQYTEVGRRWSNYGYQFSFRAMILAKLRYRADIDTLYHIHRSFLLERGYPGTLVGKFDANFVQLKTHSFN